MSRPNISAETDEFAASLDAKDPVRLARQSETYCCPVCDSRLRPHAGPVVSLHFALLPEAVCAAETGAHHTAKHGGGD